MIKKTTFMLVAFGVLVSANQASAQTARFKSFKMQSAISAKKICAHNKVGGLAVFDSPRRAMRAARSRWKTKVRSFYGYKYASWNRAKNKKSGCKKDRIEQNYRCYAVAVPCVNERVRHSAETARRLTVQK